MINPVFSLSERGLLRANTHTYKHTAATTTQSYSVCRQSTSSLRQMKMSLCSQVYPASLPVIIPSAQYTHACTPTSSSLPLPSPLHLIPFSPQPPPTSSFPPFSGFAVAMEIPSPIPRKVHLEGAGEWQTISLFPGKQTHTCTRTNSVCDFSYRFGKVVVCAYRHQSVSLGRMCSDVYVQTECDWRNTATWSNKEICCALKVLWCLSCACW